MFNWIVFLIYIEILSLLYAAGPMPVPISLLLYSAGPLAVPISLYYTLLVHCSPYITLLYSTRPLAVPISLYHTLLVHWQSLYHYTILCWPTGSPLYHYTILYWPTGSPFITILYSAGPLAAHISLYYYLLALWQSLYRSTSFY